MALFVQISRDRERNIAYDRRALFFCIALPRGTPTEKQPGLYGGAGVRAVPKHPDSYVHRDEFPAPALWDSIYAVPVQRGDISYNYLFLYGDPSVCLQEQQAGEKLIYKKVLHIMRKSRIIMQDF